MIAESVLPTVLLEVQVADWHFGVLRTSFSIQFVGDITPPVCLQKQQAGLKFGKSFDYIKQT